MSTAKSSLIALHERPSIARAKRKPANRWKCLLIASTVFSGIASSVLLFSAASVRTATANAVADPTEVNLQRLRNLRGYCKYFGFGTEYFDVIEKSIKDKQEADRGAQEANEARNAADHARMVADQARLEQAVYSAELWTHRPPIQLGFLRSALDAATALRVDCQPYLQAIALVQQPVDVADNLELRALNVRGELAKEVEIEVKSPEGKPVTNLGPADFLITDAQGKAVHHFVVERNKAAIADNTFCILADNSSSMANERMTQQVAALGTIVSRSAPSTRMKLVTFASTVLPVTDFTNDHTVLLGSLKGMKADGTTELAPAFALAIQVLSPRSGHKGIIVCTDGQDPKLAQAVESIIRDCKSRGIAVHVLAIDDPTLDKSLLTRIATETGGGMYLATQPTALATEVQQLINSFTRPVYRLGILDPKRTLNRFTVHLAGAANSKVSVSTVD